jgi:hypothetical protein
VRPQSLQLFLERSQPGVKLARRRRCGGAIARHAEQSTDTEPDRQHHDRDHGSDEQPALEWIDASLHGPSGMQRGDAAPAPVQ